MATRSFFYVQQVVLFTCAGAGLASYFLPWASFPDDIPDLLRPEGKNILTVVLFGAALLLIIIRQLGRKTATWQLWIVMACAVACLVVTLRGIQQVGEDLLFYPETGCLGSLAAAAGLFITSLAVILANAYRGAEAKEEGTAAKGAGTDEQQLFAAYILEKSGKGHLLGGIMDRCRRESITVHQHFEEGLVKNYDYSSTAARNIVAQWHVEFMAGQTAGAAAPGKSGVWVAAIIVGVCAIGFIAFLMMKR